MEVSGKLHEKENATEICEPCTVENVSNQADGFCEDCDEFMCQKCFEDHLKGKSCRNHVLDPLSGAPLRTKLRIREEKCKTHTSESVKYYCSHHDFIGCSHCIVSNHRQCEPQLIRNLALNLEESSEFKSIIRQLQKSDVEKAEIETRIGCYRKDNDMLVAKAIREIKEFHRDIDCWLDKMETNIEANVRKISDDNKKLFSQMQQMTVEISDAIDKINQLLDSNIHHGENVFIRMIECKPEVRGIDNMLSEIKSKLVFQRYNFEQGKDMKEMLNSFDKLGGLSHHYDGYRQQNEHLTEDVNSLTVAERSCLTTDSEAGDVWEAPTSNVQDFEYPLRAELEKELERIRHMFALEKEETKSLKQENYKLKNELEAQEASMLSRNGAIATSKTTERDQQEIASLENLTTNLNSKQGSRNKEYGLLESESLARHDQEQSTIESLQSELSKAREDYKRLTCQFIDVQLKRESENKNLIDLQHQMKSATCEIYALKVQLNKIDEVKQTNVPLNDIDTLSAQLDIGGKEFNRLAPKSNARQEQDLNNYLSLQAELKKISENYEKERARLNCQIKDLMLQREYDFPDPRAAGFDVGKRVTGRRKRYLGNTGTVTAVYPSGYVDVKWDNETSNRCRAGVGGQYEMKLQ